MDDAGSELVEAEDLVQGRVRHDFGDQGGVHGVAGALSNNLAEEGFAMSNRLLFDRLARVRPPHPFAARPASFGSLVREAWRRHRTRRRIANLDSRALQDIGISFAEAEAEANKPFWRG